MLAFVALSEWVMPVFALRGATPWFSIFLLFINPYRRKRGDLIQVFKILNGHYDINWEDFFTLDTDRTHNTRGHSKKLVKHRTLTSLRQKSFCYRVVDHWNNLTEEIVTAKTVTSFKTLLDKHLVNERFDTFEIY